MNTVFTFSGSEGRREDSPRVLYQCTTCQAHCNRSAHLGYTSHNLSITWATIRRNQRGIQAIKYFPHLVLSARIYTNPELQFNPVLLKKEFRKICEQNFLRQPQKSAKLFVKFSVGILIKVTCEETHLIYSSQKAAILLSMLSIHCEFAPQVV